MQVSLQPWGAGHRLDFQMPRWQNTPVVHDVSTNSMPGERLRARPASLLCAHSDLRSPMPHPGFAASPQTTGNFYHTAFAGMSATDVVPVLIGSWPAARYSGIHQQAFSHAAPGRRTSPSTASTQYNDLLNVDVATRTSVCTPARPPH